MPAPTTFFPALNATLNGLSGLFLIAGKLIIGRRAKLETTYAAAADYRLRRERLIAAHKRLMLAAVTSSALFLTSYLYYHARYHLITRFTGHGFIRPLYFTLLTSHTILAAAIVPLVLIALRRGLRREDARHRAIARITFPLWLYVSITGVLIYFMLYHWFA